MSTSPVKSVISQKELPHCTFFSSHPTAHCFLPDVFSIFPDVVGQGALPFACHCVNHRHEGMPNDKRLVNGNWVSTQNITITIYLTCFDVSCVLHFYSPRRFDGWVVYMFTVHV